MMSVRHVGIVVKDMKKAIRFYGDILGLRIATDAQESGRYIGTVLGINNCSVRTVKMSCGSGSLVELLCYKAGSFKARRRDIRAPGYSHIAFTVDNINSIYRQLISRGIKFVSSPQISPDGKAKVAFCSDPEGNFIELVEQIK